MEIKGSEWTFNAAKWHGYVLSVMFLLYGGVKIILGFLDHNTENVAAHVVFLAVGAALLTICIGYRDGKGWGWYGLIGLNGLVIILAAVGYQSGLNLVLMVLSAGALAALLAPTTRERVFGRG
ncbi:MAG: hypothetical protein KKA42_01775 [candidate division Zixibacteria bacterium]|nr:hypothetical protein [candidate division Zixibacteria bacterium]